MKQVYTREEVTVLLTIQAHLHAEKTYGNTMLMEWEKEDWYPDPGDMGTLHHGSDSFYGSMIGKVLTYLESIMPEGQQLEASKDTAKSLMRSSFHSYYESPYWTLKDAIADKTQGYFAESATKDLVTLFNGRAEKFLPLRVKK